MINLRLTDELQELVQDLTKLSNLSKIDTRELSDVLKFDDGVTIKKILTGLKKQQHAAGTQLIIFGYEFGLDISKIDLITLKKALKNLMLLTKIISSKNLKKDKELFSFSTKIRDKSTYSLCQQGKMSTIELLTKGEKHEN